MATILTMAIIKEFSSGIPDIPKNL